MKESVPTIASLLTGLRCWGFVAGAGSGSTIELLLGKKVERDRFLTNPHLDEEVRRFEAEVSLFVQCSWRLVSGGRIICTNLSVNTADGPMIDGLEGLKGKRVVSVDSSAELDQIITFNNQMKLSLFNDHLSEGPDDASFWVTTSEVIVSVIESDVSIENRGV